MSFPVFHDTLSSLDALSQTATDLLADWPRHRPRIHLPAPLGLGGSHRWYHFHTRPELFFQLGGTTVFHFPFERVELTRGHLLVVPQLLPHHERNSDTPQRFSNLVVMPSEHHMGLHLGQLSPDRSGVARIDKASQCRISSRRQQAVSACLDEASHIRHTAPDPDRERIIDKLLQSALLILADMVDEHRRQPAAAITREERARELIAINLTSASLSVGQVARWLNCHPDSLSAAFRRAFGCTVIEHITTRRIAMARSLLRDSSLSISEVGWACGFQDPAYFSRRFRQKTGMAPQCYRETAD